MILAAYVTTCFVIGGTSAIYLLRNRHREAALLQLKVAIVFAATAVPLQILAGDLQGLNVLKHQPIKIAALEGHWETQRGAPLILWAVPDETTESNSQTLEIPLLGSVLLTHDRNGEVQGLKSVPRDQRPPVKPVFYAFRVMLAVGFGMLGVVGWSVLQWRRGVENSKWLLRAWMLFTPAGFVAVLVGWYTAEIGRQPYVIYGLMRTSEAATAIDANSVLTSFLVFGVVYLFVFTAGTWYLLKLLRAGPQPATAEQLSLTAATAARPLSIVHARAQANK